MRFGELMATGTQAVFEIEEEKDTLWSSCLDPEIQQTAGGSFQGGRTTLMLG